ncbi:nickel pincer cofactor biosynthesis protein LarB [Nonomuraea insulae]|uniref:Nickel pincer cofactor biosynthesis protein LarB n=1 Tax=Nonomuraea insulae TaxID=1616787 RepID=A0ABW1CVA4_9ACTN
MTGRDSDRGTGRDSGRDDRRADLADLADLGHSTLDLDREARQGQAEVVYGPGKTVREIADIVERLLRGNDGAVLVTRIEPEPARAVLALLEPVAGLPPGHHSPAARQLVWRPRDPGAGRVTIVTAGTADGPVAEEAANTCAALGIEVTRVNDVGVAGIHRLAARADELRTAELVIVIAGMEGALASVVGGLVAAPVIAVPTSTGYGASLEGVTALLAMLSSCAAGLVVVNIDSGFGAAMAAHRILRKTA